MPKKITSESLFHILGAKLHTFQGTKFYVFDNSIEIEKIKYMVKGLPAYDDGRKLATTLPNNQKNKITNLIGLLLSNKYTELASVDGSGFIGIDNQPHPYTMFLRGLQEGINLTR